MSDKDVTVNITVGNKMPGGFASSIADHDCYVIPGITDVDKMRDEAYRRQQGDYYAKKSESTVIHMHRFNEVCDLSLENHQIWPALDSSAKEE